MGDYVIILNTADNDLFEFIVKRIQEEGLQATKSSHPESKDKAAIIVSAPNSIISLEAESWCFLKSNTKGFICEYAVNEHSSFVTPYVVVDDSLFSPSERSYITYEILKKIKMKELPDCFPRVKSGILRSDSLILSLERAQIADCWPLHSFAQLRKSAWEHGPFHRSFCDRVEGYFGPNVALYFAWLKNYLLWLTFPGVFGFLVFLYHYLNPHINVDNSHVSPVFTVFVIFWGVLFVKNWDRRCSTLVCNWGINYVRWRREIRPGYQGQKRISPITGLPERYFPDSQRMFRYAVSLAVTLFMLVIAFFVMVISLNLQGYIHKFSYSKNYLLYPSISWLCDDGQYFDPKGNGPYPMILLYIPVVIHVAIIQLLNRMYQVVANKLTEWENHRSPSQHENALYVKRFFFEAFDCYIALFYLAFVENDIVLLRRELVSLYTVDSVRRLAMETIIPFITRKIARITDNADKDANGMLYKDYDKLEYEQFDDYLEIVIQIGYVTLFAGAFPLAAPLSVVCNVLELYSDTFKLTHVTRRPVVHRITNIGVWSILVKGMVLLSIFTNLYIFCYTSEQLLNYAPWLFTVTKLSPDDARWSGSDHFHEVAPGAGMTVATILTVLEHSMLFVAACLWLLISGVPSSVTDELSRREYDKFQRTHGDIIFGVSSHEYFDSTKASVDKSHEL